MALSMLSGDQQRSVFHRVCNLLDPRDAVAFSSVDRELRASTEALLKQLRTDHEAATALCHKVGLRSCKSCKELREAKQINWFKIGLTPADLATLGTLGSVLPALEDLRLLYGSAADPDGVQRLAEGMGAGTLPAVTPGWGSVDPPQRMCIHCWGSVDPPQRMCTDCWGPRHPPTKVLFTLEGRPPPGARCA